MHLKQSEVADKLGIDFTTISKYENNKSQPDNEILKKLASLYQVSIDWLLSGRDYESQSANTIVVDGIMEPLTNEEARYVMETLEMYRLLREKRLREAGGSAPERQD